MRHLSGYYVSCRNPLTKQENAFIHLGCIFVAIRDHLSSFRLQTHQVDPTHPQTYPYSPGVSENTGECSRASFSRTERTISSHSQRLTREPRSVGDVVLRLNARGVLQAPSLVLVFDSACRLVLVVESEDVQWDAVARQHLQRLRSIAVPRGERRQTMSDTPDATPCCRAVMS